MGRQEWQVRATPAVERMGERNVACRRPAQPLYNSPQRRTRAAVNNGSPPALGRRRIAHPHTRSLLPLHSHQVLAASKVCIAALGRANFIATVLRSVTPPRYGLRARRAQAAARDSLERLTRARRPGAVAASIFIDAAHPSDPCTAYVRACVWLAQALRAEAAELVLTRSCTSSVS